MGRVRVLFSLSESQKDMLFQADEQEYVADHLAYVEWFTTFPRRPEMAHGLYKITPSADADSGYRDASIVPVWSFRRSVHLYPKFGPVVPSEWTSSTVLDQCSCFFVNAFSDRNSYYTVF